MASSADRIFEHGFGAVDVERETLTLMSSLYDGTSQFFSH